MQENKSSVGSLKSRSSPLEVNTKMQKQSTSGEAGEFSVGMCITYSLGKTRVTLSITEEGFAGRVNGVSIDISEDSGKGGSSANLNLRVTKNERYGLLCNYMTTKFVGSYDSVKENYFVPPLPEREVIRYYCRESGSGGCFTLEKKKKNEEVERVKATHDFVVDEETMHVKIRIRNCWREGLNVEVEGPVKLTTEYMNHMVSRIERKMKSEMEATPVALVRNAASATVCQRSPKGEGNDGKEDGDSRMHMQWLITQRTDTRPFDQIFLA